MKAGRLLSVCVALAMLATVSVAAAATPLAGPCMPGSAYDPACDVDHNGTIDIFDIQLTAGHWGQVGTYNIYPAVLPKTGQTSSYWSGDDGDLEKGVPWPIPRFTDNGNGTVTDNLTGLIWLKDANCARATRNWHQAIMYDVPELNSTGEMNTHDCHDTSSSGSHQTDWRLPNLRELQSLIQYGGFVGPVVPNTVGTGQWTEGDPFIRVQSENYWSSTTSAGVHGCAWYVSMYSGLLVYDWKETSSFYVWPVRGGQ